MEQVRQLALLWLVLASVHTNVHNRFNIDRHLTDCQIYKTARSAASSDWQNLMVSALALLFCNRRGEIRIFFSHPIDKFTDAWIS